jgi:hypothetical protein
MLEMPDEKKLDLALFSVVEDGPQEQLTASGLRIPLGQATWIQVDFERSAKATLVQVAARSTDRGRKLPTLSIQPHASNGLSVKFADIEGPQGELEVFPVSRGDLEGDLMDWLSRTRSGDPVGEILLGRGTVKPIAARLFRIEHWKYARVEIKLSKSKNGSLTVRIDGLSEGLTVPAKPFLLLDLVVKLHAANLVSFYFREIEGVLLEEAMKASQGSSKSIALSGAQDEKQK